MTWAKLDDGFPDHGKVNEISHGAFRLHVSAICHSSRVLSDGFVSAAWAPRLMPGFKPGFVKELVAVGLWEEAQNGWQIHDYLDYNPSAEEVKADREEAAQRMRRLRKDRKRSPERSGERARERAGERSPSCSDDVPPFVRAPRPVPSRPEGTLSNSRSSHTVVSAEPAGWGKHEARGPNETPDTRDRRRGLALRWQSVLRERGVEATHTACNEVVAKSLHVADWKVVDEQIGWFLEATVAPRSPIVLEHAVSRVAYR